MKLAYVSIFYLSDIHAWSGLGVHILRALQGAGFLTQTIGGLRYEHDYVYKAKEILYSRVFAKTYLMLWDTMLLRGFATQVESALSATETDVVFGIWGNAVTHLRTEKPVVFWGDATLAGLMERYPGYDNLCAETIRHGNRAEQLALTRCRLAIYSSDWAARTAVEHYDVDPVKVKVVPFGANITCVGNRQDVVLLVQNRNFDVCRLLFVGVDWHRKGGDIALQVASRLHQRGILPSSTSLTKSRPAICLAL